MAFKKRGRPVVPKVVFQLKSGGFFQVFVDDEDAASEVMERWDDAKKEFLEKAVGDHTAIYMEFQPTEEYRVVIAEVCAVAYVGPKSEDD